MQNVDKTIKNDLQGGLKKKDEKILVVKRDILFPNKEVNGIVSVDLDLFQNLIKSHQEFLWRSNVETDSSYKQIIPYLIFSYSGKYFLMQRNSLASEGRLKNKYSLGIGGHIREEDVREGDIMSWALREFYEEVSYDGFFAQVAFLGLINDESNFVGQVHTGFVFLINGSSDSISIKSELISGSLLPLEECGYFYEKMENWSKIVFDFLKKKYN